MDEEIEIGYFLEDVAQENFLIAFVNRIAEELEVPNSLVHVVWNKAGGRGKVLEQLKRFLRDVQSGYLRPVHILVIAIDGNCSPYQGKKNEIDHVVETSQYQGLCVHVIPDPHIERWYLLDPPAFREATDTTSDPAVPSYKCERHRYKEALRSSFQSSGIRPPFGGTEYGAEIAKRMNLHYAGRQDPSLRHFIDELKEAFSRLASLNPY